MFVEPLDKTQENIVYGSHFGIVMRVYGPRHIGIYSLFAPFQRQS